MTTTNTQGAADLFALIEAYAELRHKQGYGSYNANTYAAWQAVKDAIAGKEAAHLRELAAYRLTVENLEREIAAQQPAPSAAAALPEGWVPLVITHEGQYPEEVAYGPQIMMDRLAKWLGQHFERTIEEKAAPQQPAPSPAPAVSDEDEALDLLATLFDAWENGTPCYEEPESSDGFLGHAFRLDDKVFHRCADLLNRRRGKQPAPTAQADTQPAPDERDDFEKVFPLPSGCIRVGTGYASTGYSNWAAHTHCERWQGWQARAARAPADSVTAPAGAAPTAPEGFQLVKLELLREARDNCRASIAEDGISGMRKEYRIDLEARLTSAVAAHTPTAQADTQPAPAQDEREAFEDWALSERLGAPTEQMGFRFHDAGNMHPAWKAWQARAARAPADSVQEDAARLDWLEQNLFHREMDEWDVKFGGRGDQNMWVLFAPKGVQGSARRIIDAARKQGATP